MAIKRLQKGGTPTLLDAQKGNELIDKINALSNIEVKESDKYFATVGSAKTVIEIKKPPEQSPTNQVGGGEPPVEYETLELHVCIDGEVKIVEFVINDIRDA